MTAIRALPPDPIAPWAEIVPHAPRHMTVADLLDWPDDDGYRYEVVEGVLVRMAGTRPEAGAITRGLLFPLAAFVQAHGLGTVTLPDEVYDVEHTGQPNTGLLPDIGFYYASRAPLAAPREPIPLPPIWPSRLRPRRGTTTPWTRRPGATCGAARPWCGSHGPTSRRSTCGIPAMTRHPRP